MHDRNLKNYVKITPLNHRVPTVFDANIQQMSHKDGTDGVGRREKYSKKRGGESTIRKKV